MISGRPRKRTGVTLVSPSATIAYSLDPDRIPIIVLIGAHITLFCPIGVHDVNLGMAIPVRPESDLGTIGRPGRMFVPFPIVSSKLSSICPITVNDPYFVISTIIGDEGDTVAGRRPDGLPGDASSHLGDLALGLIKEVIVEDLLPMLLLIAPFLLNESLVPAVGREGFFSIGRVPRSPVRQEGYVTTIGIHDKR